MSQRRKLPSYLDIGEIAQSLRAHVKLRNIISFGYLNYAEIWCSLPIFQQNSWKLRRHIPYFLFTIMGEVARSKWMITVVFVVAQDWGEPSNERSARSNYASNSWIWQALCSRLNCFELELNATQRALIVFLKTGSLTCLSSADWNIRWIVTISSSFPKKDMYVPHQQDSYGPDITKKQHSKIHFIFTTTRKVHHRKIENVHL